MRANLTLPDRSSMGSMRAAIGPKAAARNECPRPPSPCSSGNAWLAPSPMPAFSAGDGLGVASIAAVVRQGAVLLASA
jgi:hypothetical protein